MEYCLLFVVQYWLQNFLYQPMLLELVIASPLNFSSLVKLFKVVVYHWLHAVYLLYSELANVLGDAKHESIFSHMTLKCMPK